MAGSQKISWNEIHNEGYVLPVLVLCLGIVIFGSDYAFGATIMPIAVQEIGGERLINWVVSIFELGAILSAVSVPILVKRWQFIHILNAGAGLYMLSCGIISIAPHMEIIVAARFTQGLGGGVFISLALITIATIFPPRYYIRLMVIVSAVWGSASFAGPLIGSVFAELGIWRAGYVFMAGLASVAVIGYNFHLLPFLKRRHAEELILEESNDRLPKIRLMVLALSILCFAMAGISKDSLTTIGLVGAGILCFAYMIRRDKAAKVNILPKSIFTATPSGYGMLIALLAPMASITISTYGPILMSLQFSTTPIVNGYVIAVIAITWGSSAFIVGHLNEAIAPIVMRCGMLIVAVSQIGMGLGFYTGIFYLIPAFAILEGMGFGICWSFIAQRTIRLAPKDDRTRISTSIFTMQRIGFSMGSALLGIIVNNLGFSTELAPASISTIGFFTLIAPVPLILIAAIFAWKLAKVPLPDE